MSRPLSTAALLLCAVAACSDTGGAIASEQYRVDEADRTFQNAVGDLLRDAARREQARNTVAGSLAALADGTTEKKEEARARVAEAAGVLLDYAYQPEDIRPRLRAAAGDGPEGTFVDDPAAPTVVIVTGDPHTTALRDHLLDHSQGHELLDVSWTGESDFANLTVLGRTTATATAYRTVLNNSESTERRLHRLLPRGWEVVDFFYRANSGDSTVVVWMRLPNTRWFKSLRTTAAKVTDKLRAASEEGFEVVRAFVSKGEDPDLANSDGVVILQSGHDFRVIAEKTADLPDALSGAVADGGEAVVFGYTGDDNSAAWLTYAGDDPGAAPHVLVEADSPSALADAIDGYGSYEVEELYYRGDGTAVWLDCPGGLDVVTEVASDEPEGERYSRLAQRLAPKLATCSVRELHHRGGDAMALFRADAPAYR